MRIIRICKLFANKSQYAARLSYMAGVWHGDSGDGAANHGRAALSPQRFLWPRFWAAYVLG